MTKTEDLLRDVLQSRAAKAPDAGRLVATSIDMARKESQRRRASTAALFAVAACAAGLAVVFVGGGDDPGDVRRETAAQTSAPAPALSRHGALTDAGDTKCVELYSVAGLADKPLVLDATVTTIAPPPATTQTDLFAGSALTTLTINRWFRDGDGGDAATLDVLMTAPQTIADEEGTASYEVGTRLLVVAQPLNAGAPGLITALGCGFTRYYDETTATEWADAVE